MTLWKPDHQPDVSAEDAIAVVHEFVSRCQHWAAEIELPKRLKALDSHPDEDQIASLQRWASYLAMTEHTLRELEDGTLDRWFRDTNTSSRSDT